MTPSKSPLGSTALLVVAALALTTGCAANRRETYLQEKAGTHVYRLPIAEVWPKAKEVLTEEGYSVMEAKGGFEMQTDWMMQGAPSSLGTSYARYLIRGIEKGPGQCSVEFLKQNRVEAQGAHDPNNNNQSVGGEPPPATNATGLTRDYALEWKLLQKVDPETAKAWEAEAAQKVQ
ncbi:hypothetical protein [Hyalangium sp.]|uniref:hypothetical protein n=1 Tax=Hyalangium sp. TaxID=2028555 RepID=UPI002D3D5C1E|nr:hypothetical protein [Hyalangium sp.]HYH94780.1 hypothetical protein [Hyalangium sp.]